MPNPSSQTNFYETDKAVSEYLLFHYGSKEDLLFQGIGPPKLNFAKDAGDYTRTSILNAKSWISVALWVAQASP